ncbi:MAG: DUF368 domain-containing protein [Halobacteriovoraceae bacterium]|nr:DUF368 domain-containing protein [Halobacteriovoraceae bacterium]
MGMADIVPGVSGGTIALVTGIYDELVSSIAKINKTAVDLLIQKRFKDLLDHINISFLIPLGVGILTAIILMSRIMHFLMNEHAIYTWSFFFGLILASVVYVAKHIPNLKKPINLVALGVGSITGYLAVSLIPVNTPETHLMLFLSGAIAICAMILPGISGSFILLILGKYMSITSALKNPFVGDNITAIIVFSSGCLLGLLSFSKMLNFLLKNYYGLTMSLLTGFMIGSLKKIWPWKSAINEIIIRGKRHVLEEANYLPDHLNSEVILALIFAGLGLALIFFVERLGQTVESK